MTKTFNPAPILDRLGGALSLLVMAGLTVASVATASAQWGEAKPSSALPAAVAVVHEVVQDVVQLPAVVVTVKRVGHGV
jgi:hypothetical protein